MFYYNVKRGKLPIAHPHYKEDSNMLINPLCKAIGATENIASYSDKEGNVYVQNPIPDFLTGADSLFEENGIGLLYTGYGLGLENDLYSYSIGTVDSKENITGRLTVQKNSDYGYDVLANGSIVTTEGKMRMSKIAPIIYFELVGSGGGGSGSRGYISQIGSGNGNGGGGGGGCVRGLIDLSKITDIYYQVGIGGAGGDWATSGNKGDDSSISVINTSTWPLEILIIEIEGGKGGTVFVNYNEGGIGGSGGIYYVTHNGADITIEDLASRGHQTGLHVLAAVDGGWGGNGATGEGATPGEGTSIGAYTLAGKIIVPPSATSDTSLIGPNKVDVSNSKSQVAGGGGGSPLGQGGCPGISGSTGYNGQWEQQHPGNGSFPGGGGGGACYVSAKYDRYTGGNGANGRLLIKFAYMPAPSGVTVNVGSGSGGSSGGGDIIINPGPGFEETIK